MRPLGRPRPIGCSEGRQTGRVGEGGVLTRGEKAAGRWASMMEREGCISQDQYWEDWEKTAVSPAKNKRGE